MIKIRFLIIICFLAFVLPACRVTRMSQPAKGIKRYEISYKGYDRYFLVYAPENENSTKPQPVLFALHGGGGIPENMIWLTNERFNRLADEHGFIVIYPQGYDKGWNDGRVGDHSTAATQNIDDVGFLKRIIEDISTTLNIDHRRIYTCGISNGGFMSSRLACEASDFIRGAAIITATVGEEFSAKCREARPTDIMVINGTLDPLVPYEGGSVHVGRRERGRIVSTNDYVKNWGRTNQCTPEPVVTRLADKDRYDDCLTDRIEWSNGKDGSRVVLLRVEGGGHTWPGGRKYLTEGLVGKTTMDFNACEEIIEFFNLNNL